MTEYYNKTIDEINSQKFVEDLFSFLERIFSKEKIVEDCYRELKSFEGIMSSMPFTIKISKKRTSFRTVLELVIWASELVAEAEVVLKRYSSIIGKKEKKRYKKRYNPFNKKPYLLP